MSNNNTIPSHKSNQNTKGGSLESPQILCTFSLTNKSNFEENRFEKLSALKKSLQKELNKSITVDECDAALLAGALLLNDSNAVKEQARLVTDINIRLWGNAVDPLSKWIIQHNILPEVTKMNKFIEGNTRMFRFYDYLQSKFYFNLYIFYIIFSITFCCFNR